jgi:hypothetical protein
LQLPIWNGEFGPVYQNEDDGLADWEKINTSRYHVLKTQLGIYAKNNTSWSIWLYKDLGFQGMQYVKKDTAYMKRMAPFLKKKKVRSVDSCDWIIGGEELWLTACICYTASSSRRVGCR